MHPEAITYSVDMSDVRGQEHVKRALEVAVADGHNVLTLGTKRLLPLGGLSAAHTPLTRVKDFVMVASPTFLRWAPQRIATTSLR